MRRLLTAGLLLLGPPGPFDIPLFNTPSAPNASGSARLVHADSPFGVAVTSDGVASYNVVLELSGLPDPKTLGEYTSYVAWAATTDLARWVRLGRVANGKGLVGRIELNKFLLVITAERDSLAKARSGPTVLHGSSPSTLLQSFLSHPLFRGIPPQ